MRPLDEYPPGVRAPGEGYTGPIADPEEAVRACMASKDVLAEAARYAADPDAPVKAYLSAKDVWEKPWKYAGYPRPEAASVRTQAASAPASASLHDAPMRDGVTFDPTVAAAAPAPDAGSSERPGMKPYSGLVVTIADRDRREDEKKQQEQTRRNLRVGPRFRKQTGGMEVPNIPLLGGAAPMPRGTAAPPARATPPSPAAGAPTSKGAPTPEADPTPAATKDVLMPGGQPVGVVQSDATPEIRTVSPPEFQRIQADLMVGARPVAKPGYPGTWYQRPDGTGFGLRQSGRFGVTIDVDDPSFDPGFKVHQR